MNILQSNAAELMDDPARATEELRGSFRDLERMNRLLGAHAIVRAYLNRVLPVWRSRPAPARSVLTVLDVATGGGDVPTAVAAWAARAGIAVRIAAVERHPTTARLASAATASCRAVTVLRADARTLPFREASVDLCLCTLALHHLPPEERLALIGSLNRLARIGFLVVDLLRCAAGYGGAWLLTRLSSNRLIRHDGPLSVRRASSWDEYRRLAEAAGIPGLRLVRHPFFRVSLSRIG